MGIHAQVLKLFLKSKEAVTIKVKVMVTSEGREGIITAKGHKRASGAILFLDLGYMDVCSMINQWAVLPVCISLHGCYISW